MIKLTQMVEQLHTLTEDKRQMQTQLKEANHAISGLTAERDTLTQTSAEVILESEMKDAIITMVQNELVVKTTQITIY